MKNLEEQLIERSKDNLMERATPIIDGILKEENTKMPESVFKGRYLDSFANGNNPEAIKEFASVAGSFYSGVDVVDDITEEVLFTTPPMIESVDFDKIEQIAKTDISGLVKETEQKINVNHPAGTKELDSTLDSIEDKMVLLANEATKANKDKWKLIFSKYGIGEKPKEITDDEVYDYD